jgi:hypothetical protein
MEFHRFIYLGILDVSRPMKHGEKEGSEMFGKKKKGSSAHLGLYVGREQ